MRRKRKRYVREKKRVKEREQNTKEKIKKAEKSCFIIEPIILILFCKVKNEHHQSDSSKGPHSLVYKKKSEENFFCNSYFL